MFKQDIRCTSFKQPLGTNYYFPETGKKLRCETCTIFNASGLDFKTVYLLKNILLGLLKQTPDLKKVLKCATKKLVRMPEKKIRISNSNQQL